MTEIPHSQRSFNGDIVSANPETSLEHRILLLNHGADPQTRSVQIRVGSIGNDQSSALQSKAPLVETNAQKTGIHDRKGQTL